MGDRHGSGSRIQRPAQSPVVLFLGSRLVTCGGDCRLRSSQSVASAARSEPARQRNSRSSERRSAATEELVAELGTESAEAGAKLPGLLAYKNAIESVREWPFDAPTLTRFFLYVAIPLGSWVGGALVERLLGAALD